MCIGGGSIKPVIWFLLLIGFGALTWIWDYIPFEIFFEEF